MPPARLVQLSNFDRPQGGSFVPLVRGALAAARRRGWATDMVLLESARECAWVADLEGDGAAVHFAPESARSDRALGRWLAGILGERDEPAVLHSHFHGFDVASVLAARRHRGDVVIWHIHSTYSRNPLKVMRASAKLGILGRRVDAILCPAENIVDSTVKRLAPRARVHFVPSAIEAESFPEGTLEERARARLALGLPPDATVLLHFGWHWRLKGGDIFLEVVKRVVEAGGADVVAVERGGHEEYEELAHRLGIGEHLRVFGPVGQIRSLHLAADVLVSSSRIEGMAYTLLESLCVGTPVVSTDIPGHAFLGAHVDACRITGHGPGEIAAGIAETIARPAEQVQAEADQAHEWITANLGVDVIAEQLVDRYEELLAGRP